MFSTFGFLIKMAILIGVVMAFMFMEGVITITAFDYKVTAHIAAFITIVIIALYILSFVLRTFFAIVTLPTTISEYRHRNTYRNGLKAIASGLSAIAAGDIKQAEKQTKIAARLKGRDYGISILMEGLTNRLKGEDTAANVNFHSLLKIKETSMLGVRGLLQTALDKGDYRYATVLARQAFSMHPKQSWIINILYDLETRQKNFDAAEDLLETKERLKILTRKQARAEKAVLALAQDESEWAYKLNAQSLPTTLPYLKTLVEKGKNRKARSIIKSLWSITPHPTLMDLWMSLASHKHQKNPLKMIAWAESLRDINKDDASSSLYTAEIGLRYTQNEQALRFLKYAYALQPTVRTCQLLHRLDPSGEWLTKITHAKQDKAWVCRVTGKIHIDWRPYCDGGHFNTITWTYPDEAERVTDILSSVRLPLLSPTSLAA